MVQSTQTQGTGAGQGGASAADYGYGPNGGQIEQQGTGIPPGLLDALKLLGYGTPAAPVMGLIDSMQGGSPAETLGPLTDPWRKEGMFGIQNPDVGAHPNPTGTGSPGGTGPGPGAMIPNQAGIDALIPEYGGGGPAPAPTPPPTGDNYMPTPHMNVEGALDQISGGESSPMPPGAEKRGDATVYTIQPGDSLSLIGAMFGLTYDELIAGNEGLLGEKGKSTVIHPGQTILVSAPPGTAARGSKEREKVADKGLDVKGATEYSKARRR